MVFADDVDIIGSTSNLNETFTRFEKEAEKMGLLINENNNKYMYTSSNTEKDAELDKMRTNKDI